MVLALNRGWLAGTLPTEQRPLHVLVEDGWPAGWSRRWWWLMPPGGARWAGEVENRSGRSWLLSLGMLMADDMRAVIGLGRFT
jgi:hypothetical protein